MIDINKDQFFVFLDPASFFVDWNINRMGGDRLTSAAAGAVISGTDPRRYIDGSAEHAACVPDPSDPSGWGRNSNMFGGLVSPYQGYLLSGRGGPYVQEYEGELVRHAEFPRTPSRLSCLYAFGSVE